MKSFGYQTTQAPSFKKNKTLLLSATFAGVLFFFAPTQNPVFNSLNKAHAQKFFASSPHFLQTGIFGSLLSGIASVAGAVLDIAGKVTGVTKTVENVKKATTTEASAGQKVVALGSLGGGVALIALLFFFLL